MTNQSPIGFFDSGIGGKTVLEETKKLLPNENYIYLADSKNNPYGDKDDETIKVLVEKSIDFLTSKGCKMIVLACNTATSVCIGDLRKKYNIPIIGTEPAVKLAAVQKKQKKILVMATPATIKSEKFLKIYKEYNSNNIVLLPCPGLANIIEQNKQKEINAYLKNILKEYKDFEVIVLGCTHYIYIKNNINIILPNVEFIDGNKSIAKQIKKVLEEKNLINNCNNQNPGIEFFDTKYISY